MTPTASAYQSGFIGAWAWLLPATYLVHIAEEFWAPPTFYVWAAAFAGVPFTAQSFVVANALFLTLMVLAVALVLHDIWAPWVVVALATIVALNAVLHLLGTVLSCSYSPGLVSGLVLYLPLGGAVLVRGTRQLSGGAVRRGVAAGVLVHALVPAVGFLLSILLPA